MFKASHYIGLNLIQSILNQKGNYTLNIIGHHIDLLHYEDSSKYWIFLWRPNDAELLASYKYNIKSINEQFQVKNGLTCMNRNVRKMA